MVPPDIIIIRLLLLLPPPMQRITKHHHHRYHHFVSMTVVSHPIIPLSWGIWIFVPKCWKNKKWPCPSITKKNTNKWYINWLRRSNMIHWMIWMNCIEDYTIRIVWWDMKPYYVISHRHLRWNVNRDIIILINVVHPIRIVYCINQIWVTAIQIQQFQQPQQFNHCCMNRLISFNHPITNQSGPRLRYNWMNHTCYGPN